MPPAKLSKKVIKRRTVDRQPINKTKKTRIEEDEGEEELDETVTADVVVNEETALEEEERPAIADYEAHKECRFDVYVDHYVKGVKDEALKENGEVRKENVIMSGVPGQYTHSDIVDVFADYPVDGSSSPSHFALSPAVADRLAAHELGDEAKALLDGAMRYTDVLMARRTAENGEQMRLVYLAHAITHILRGRHRVIQNTESLRAGRCTYDDPSVRDQSIIRPKVLILLPFRHSALRLVANINDLLFGGRTKRQTNVVNRARFEDEFGQRDRDSMRDDLPQDYKEMFEGNVDDCFRLGVSITKKSMKLFVQFYASDLIIASPLGLAQLIDDDAKGSTDFLSSLELLIVDECDVFLMHNWAHLLTIVQRANRPCHDSHEADFARVWRWALNDMTAHYRQTIVVASTMCGEMRAMFNKQCVNYAGKVVFAPNYPPDGVLRRIGNSSLITHAFLRFSAPSLADSADARFVHFTSTVLPAHVAVVKSGTLIVVPSYFDFVRVRNHLKKSDVSFVQCSEYSTNAKVSRGRDMFYHGHKQCMLITERFHFYKRYLIRGVRHIIFYQPLHFAHLYAELCNLTRDVLGRHYYGTDRLVVHDSERRRRVTDEGEEEEEERHCTISTLYCAHDSIRLAYTVGPKMAQSLVRAEGGRHVIKI